MSVPKGEKVDHITVIQRISAEKAIRRATVSDIPALLEVENRSFESDRLTRRNFNYLLKRGNAVCLVETADQFDMRTEGRIAGYVLLLFNAGTSLSRLYSFAVDPDFRRTGVAYRLLDAAEREARDHECVYIRLRFGATTNLQSTFTAAGLSRVRHLPRLLRRPYGSASPGKAPAARDRTQRKGALL